MKKRALISVSDKKNIVDFAKELVALDFEIISTGGTKKTLDDSGVPTISIDEVTNFKEMLDGRVKTLHPNIHGGLLAIRDNEEHVRAVHENNIQYIDLVAVNLYPFKETISKPNVEHHDAIENIDIGGPSMLRSAAKNHQYVTVVCDANDYSIVIDELKTNGETTLPTREKLAAKVFRHTASYDAMIAEYFTTYVKEENPEKVTLTFDLKQSLRYGENPHQKASFYQGMSKNAYSLVDAVQLHGKELSYNNIQDTNAALNIVKEYKNEIVVVAVKHMNPCGVAIGSTILEAWEKAYAADPVSIFGGIVATNGIINEDVAKQLNSIFLEIIIAKGYTEGALELLKLKKNIRLLTLDLEETKTKNTTFVSVNGGMLLQDADDFDIKDLEITIPTNRKPTESETRDLLFAWRCVKHVKSNAICLAKDGQTVGIGAGQMNRVGAAAIAIEQAGSKSIGSVMASDAFFPMSDTVELARLAGVTAIIQPGGSIKDEESIKACNEAGIAMIFTHVRHFKH